MFARFLILINSTFYKYSKKIAIFISFIVTLIVIVNIHHDYESRVVNTIMLDSKFKLHEENANNKFIVNNRILQYSSYAVIENNDKMNIETFVMFNYEHERPYWFRKNLMCAIKMHNESRVEISNIQERLMVPLMKIRNNPKDLWIIKCTFRKTNLTHFKNEVRVAIIDKRDMKPSKENSGFKIPNSFMPLEYVQFQKPKVVNKNKPKKKAVAHCVHYLRDISNERFESLRRT